MTNWRQLFGMDAPKEKRDAAYTDELVRLIQARASGTYADNAATAATETAAGLLARSFMGAVVKAEDRVKMAITPAFLAQVGRDLIRKGESLHVIELDGGSVVLLPAGSWSLTGGPFPSSWLFEATVGAPSESYTYKVPGNGVIFLTWGTNPNEPYRGTSPLSFASLSSRMNSETEKSLGDESAGPLTNFLPIPMPPKSDDDDNKLAPLQAEIAKARGDAMLVESVADGMGTGERGSPTKDWNPNRLGPMPPEALVILQKQSFLGMLAACGVPPGLFDSSSGQQQKESLKHYHNTTVLPLSVLLEKELSEKLETDVTLEYPRTASGTLERAQALQKLIESGVEASKALALSGLLLENG